MKDLQNLAGTKILSKKEQQSIKGGYSPSFCAEGGICPAGGYCEGVICVPNDPNTGGDDSDGPYEPGGLDPK